jgi:two-component system sensor histidine kinase TctE
MRLALPAPRSIRRRLIVQLLVVAALLAMLLYFSIRSVARDAAETTQDSVLGAATTAIAEQLRGSAEGVEIDIPYSAFSMLGSISEDRVFYRIIVADQTVTGYEDLPAPIDTAPLLTPVYYTRNFRDTQVRIAAVTRAILVGRDSVRVQVLVAQTRQGQEAIVATMANRGAALGLGFFAVAALLSLLTANTALRPLNYIAGAVGRRGPQDLRPVTQEAPSELVPLITSLNGFIARLRGALCRTETFITEAAHHIRTPLATVRAQAEIALRQTDDDDTRATLHRMIRAIEDSSRSASQLLDHATVVYRTDQRANERFDLADLLRGVVRSLDPTADLKDLTLATTLPEAPMIIEGDRLLIESALRNLIDNAIKYSPADNRIGITLLKDGGSAMIIITDDGRGIGTLATGDLVGRFKRGGNVADVVGSGLGLTIVDEVATAHGGTLDLQNRNGGGTCVRFSLPLP